MENEIQQTSTPAPVPKKKNLKFFVYGLIGVLVIGILGAVGVGVYRVYAQTATDSFTIGIARFLRLPAAKINGKSISYVQYIEDMRAIRKFRDAQGGGSEISDDTLSDQVFLRLASNVLVAEAAERYKVTVDAKDMDQETETLLQSKNLQYAMETDEQKRAGLRDQTVKQVNEDLKQLYGWSLDEYRERVLKFLVLVKKVGLEMQKDKVLRDESKNKAADVLAQIKGGADFAAMAMQYGTDGTAQAGGDLDWFAKGKMVPEFEKVAFELKKGELSDVVETEFGYHIIKAVDRRTVKDKDANGKTISRDEVRASHILFRPDMQKYLDSALLSSKYRLYLKAHDPFGELKNQLQKKAY